jgi:hypothetical protein
MTAGYGPDLGLSQRGWDLGRFDTSLMFERGP